MSVSAGKARNNRVLNALLALFALLVIASLLLIPKGFFNKSEPVVAPAVQPIAITAPIQVITFIAYTIKKKDTLTKISRDTCNSIDELVSRNGIKNPDKIFAGRSLIFLKVESCSPELVKSKTFPEKFASRTHDGASQEKSFTQPEIGAPSSPKQEAAEKDTPIKTETPTPVNIVAATKENCKKAGKRIRDFAKKTMVRAECIKRNYGAIIKEGIATIDERVPHLEVVARMIIESEGNPNALNKQSNCKGLMQLQPATAKQYGVDLKKIYDPRENIFGGIRVISDYTYRLFGGDENRGRVAYNAGPHHRLFRRQNFDPSRFKYVREVQEVLDVLDKHQFSL